MQSPSPHYARDIPPTVDGGLTDRRGGDNRSLVAHHSAVDRENSPAGGTNARRSQ
jgi:hypothetical protein